MEPVVPSTGWGVTHLFFDYGAALFFPTQSESQTYRPRYGLSSYNFLQPFIMANAPAGQLTGLSGAGWLPVLDVLEEHAPAATPEMEQCLADMQQRGVDVSRQNYRYVAYVTCDTPEVIALAAEQAGKGRSTLIGQLEAM